IVKVAADKQGVEGERVTVGGTIYYQLEHCSYDSSKKHSRVVTWFGSVSYRKLKFTPEKKKELCPLCKHELIDVKYFGANWLAVQGSDKRDTWEDYEEEGRPVFIPYERGGGGCHGWQA
ncbi:hypothetical protein MUP77_11215, partial [Candidatus Bathyarchaeota archaeon]|nr:hypothetical protein [Candidatus Bathyarchaeota archaeon]